MNTELTIESLDQEGRGVAHAEGKVVFVEGGLPGERLRVEFIKEKPTYAIARAVSIEQANAARVVPRCPHFGVCGGCTLQHADESLQLAAKQRALEDALQRLGRVTPDTLLPAIAGPAWGYRYRARMSVRDVAKKGGVLVGFHERKSSFVADMRECHVMPPKISALLPALRTLIESLSIRKRVPQIEVAVGERLTPRTVSTAFIERSPSTMDTKTPADEQGRLVYALVLRVLERPSVGDEAKLVAFADANGVELWLQSGGPDTVVPFHPPGATLAYTLPEYDIAVPFAPTDFTQVNASINRVLVRKALQLLDPQPGECVADFFCGLGNFTLPIARRGAVVIGVEGSKSLVARARANADRNGLSERTTFVCANLFTATTDSVAALGALDRALIDPPREGAIELVKSLPHGQDERRLQRIVYVSCSPATLARDAGVLVHERGYRLATAGVVNMFPHTAHVESMAVFE